MLKTRLIHCAGRCDLVFGKDDKQILTCGEDTLVKFVDVGTDKLINEFDALCGEKEVIALDFNVARGDCFAVGTAFGDVQLFSYPDAKLMTNLTRTSLSVRSIAFSPDGSTIGVTSDDSAIKLVNVDDIVQSYEIQGHEGPVKHLSFDPKGKYLASSGCDGTVKIWNISEWKTNNSCSLVKTINCLVKDVAGDVDTMDVAKLQWSPSGSALALPGNKDVRITSRDNWNNSILLKDGHIKPVTIVAWSPNGLYLTSFGLDNNLVVWDTTTKQVVKKFTVQDEIYSLKWCEKNNIFALIDKEGQYSIVKDVITGNLPSPTETITLNYAFDSSSNGVGTDIGTGTGTGTLATPASSSSTTPAPAKTIISADTSNDTDDTPIPTETVSDTTNVSEIKAQLGMDTDKAPLTEDQEKELHRQHLLQSNDESMVNDDTMSDHENNQSSSNLIVKQVMPDRIPMQEPFQPAASPYDEKKRYLVWNSVGLIISREEDTYNSIEIEFADIQKHRTIRFTDHFNFKMAALADNGAFFASESLNDKKDLLDDDYDMADNEKKSSNAVLFYRPFDSWTHNSEWSVNLDSKEDVDCVACGTTFCCAATSKRLLRVFRPSGIQDAPMLLPGPILSMVATGPLLLIVYHVVEPTLDGTHTLGYQFLNFGEEGSSNGYSISQSLISQGSIPAPFGAKEPIRWIGFTDEATGLMPVVLDSKGMLCGLSKYSGWSWVPLLDCYSKAIRKSKTERFWPVSVRSNKMVTVVTKGRNSFPLILPRPVLQSFDLCIPLLGVHLTKGGLKHKLEAESLKNAICLQQRKWSTRGTVGALAIGMNEDDALNKLQREEAALDASIIKQILLAMKLDKLNRAYGLAKRLRLAKSIQIAAQQGLNVVGNSNLTGGSVYIEKMQVLLQSRIEEEEDAASDDDLDDSGDDMSDVDDENQLTNNFYKNSTSIKEKIQKPNLIKSTARRGTLKGGSHVTRASKSSLNSHVSVTKFSQVQDNEEREAEQEFMNDADDVEAEDESEAEQEFVMNDNDDNDDDDDDELDGMDDEQEVQHESDAELSDTGTVDVSSSKSKSKSTSSRKIRFQDEEHSDDDDVSSNKRIKTSHQPVSSNPFAKKITAMSPRSLSKANSSGSNSVFAVFDKSPVRPPKLSRASSFSIEARNEHHRKIKESTANKKKKSVKANKTTSKASKKNDCTKAKTKQKVKVAKPAKPVKKEIRMKKLAFTKVSNSADTKTNEIRELRSKKSNDVAA